MSEIQFVNDHHPLDNAELLKLLAEADSLALNEANVQRISAIQCRLADAIPGMTCPRPVDGLVAERLADLDHLYVQAKESGMLLNALVIARFHELTS